MEKHINSMFHKLGLTEETDVHRRVMAVLRVPSRDRACVAARVTHCARLVSTMKNAARRVPERQVGMLSRTRAPRSRAVPRLPTTIVSRAELLRDGDDPLRRLAVLDARAGRHAGEPFGDVGQSIRSGSAALPGSTTDRRSPSRPHQQDHQIRFAVPREAGRVITRQVRMQRRSPFPPRSSSSPVRLPRSFLEPER